MQALENPPIISASTISPEWQHKSALKIFEGYPTDWKFVESFLALSPLVAHSDDIVVSAAIQTLASMPQEIPTLSLSDKLDMARASVALGYSRLTIESAYQSFSDTNPFVNKFGIKAEDVLLSVQRIHDDRIDPYWITTFNQLVDANGGRPLITAPEVSNNKLPYVREAGGPFTWPEWIVKNNLLGDSEVEELLRNPQWRNASIHAAIQLHERHAITRENATAVILRLQGGDVGLHKILLQVSLRDFPQQKLSKRSTVRIVDQYLSLLTDGRLQPFEDFALQAIRPAQPRKSSPRSTAAPPSSERLSKEFPDVAHAQSPFNSYLFRTHPLFIRTEGNPHHSNPTAISAREILETILPSSNRQNNGKSFTREEYKEFHTRKAAYLVMALYAIQGQVMTKRFGISQDDIRYYQSIVEQNDWPEWGQTLVETIRMRVKGEITPSQVRNKLNPKKFDALGRRIEAKEISAKPRRTAQVMLQS